MSDYDACVEVGKEYLTPAGCPVRVLAVEQVPASTTLHPGWARRAQVEYIDEANSYGYGAGTIAWFSTDDLGIRCPSCGARAELSGYCEECDMNQQAQEALHWDGTYTDDDWQDDYVDPSVDWCWWCPECGEPEYNPSPTCPTCIARAEQERYAALDLLYADVLPGVVDSRMQIAPGVGIWIPF